MSWVLLKWNVTDGDARLPRFRNMYDIMPSTSWLKIPTLKRNRWNVVTTTGTEEEAKALLNLMPKYNDDTQTS
jgi:hypothetical protein